MPRLNKLLDRLPINHLRRARSVVDGPVPLVVAFVASLAAAFAVAVYVVPIAAGLTYAAMTGVAAGLGVMCAVFAATDAASFALAGAVTKREPLEPLFSAVDDVAVALGGTLKAIFKPKCERAATLKLATGHARSSGQFGRSANKPSKPF